ncbi:hypothetical protein BDA99DRAFT_603761 [Phascolomyces articulosus]|uniref:Bromo domain-containing protein n=1 Tax=Phascolomyces articulosus TaxID=60185 RepID=A0AAD5PG51_9FUNG|nr:hypothetical protein BDA99DRAFT_603761 [Phascolomyces articulosus]
MLHRQEEEDEEQQRQLLLHHGLPPWPQLTFVLSKEIIKNDLHNTFLTSTESHHFEAAVESYSQWYAFINGTNEDYHAYPISERALSAMRVRAMLTEQFIPHVYHSERLCCQHAKIIDLDRICQETRSLQLPDIPNTITQNNRPASSSSPQQLPQQRPSSTGSQSQSASLDSEIPLVPVKKEEDSSNNHSNHHPTTATPPSFLNSSTNASAPNASSSSSNEDTASKNDATVPTFNINTPLIDVFHTLDQDRTAMVELQKLEESEAQEEMNEEEEKDPAEEHSLSILNTTGNFNLKYLLQGIAANRQKTTLSDRDIRNLLSDFKPHRTKWASDDKIGQEELYEACEKVLTDLKNFTEHSGPFLNKVSKREAPDYFEVIKRPMDLGTVTKKMKALQYKSKKEFSDDLYLIYENCLLYNTNPVSRINNVTSEYRKHANAMKRKTDRLMARVPDITIKDRTEQETEEFGDEASEDGDSDIQRVSRGKATGGHKHPASQSEPPRSSRERSLTRESSAAPSISDAFDDNMTPNGHAPHKMYGGKQVRGSHTDQDGKNTYVDMEGLIELQDHLWHDLTKKSRAKMASDTEKQYQFPFEDREAIIRSPLDMERFAMLEHAHHKPEIVQKLIKCPSDRFTKWAERNGPGISLYDDVEFDSSDDENLDVFFSRKIAKPTKTEQDDAMRTDLFLPEYMIASGLPEIYSMRDNILDDQERGRVVRRGSIDTNYESVQPKQYTDVPLDVYPSVRFSNHGLSSMVDRNLRQLQKVRVVYAKCNAIKNNIPISTLANSISLADPLIDASSNTALTALVPANKKQLPPLIIDQKSGLQLIQRTLSKLLGHAGFEGAQSTALNVLTELAIDYMLNVGRTIRSYWDDYGRQMSNEEILMHVLYENGVSNITELESYIRDDVERYGHRLDELHRRLESSYQDILTGPIEKSDDEGVLQDEETFVTGSFGEDIGEDYFGFKELGLDREYNIDAFSIPTRLWFGGNKEKIQTKSSSKEPTPNYPPPPPFTPVTTEKQLIGLLQPVFQKKLADTTRTLVEDEYIPNRHRIKPRYPPTNKTTTNRKKPLKDSGMNSASAGGAGGAGGENRKTKRKRPPEEIQAIKAERAEKKRQKLEEKAQRTAEKEQRRKLREELKEQGRLAKQEAKEKKVGPSSTAQAKKAAAAANANTTTATTTSTTTTTTNNNSNNNNTTTNNS